MEERRQPAANQTVIALIRWCIAAAPSMVAQQRVLALWRGDLRRVPDHGLDEMIEAWCYDALACAAYDENVAGDIEDLAAMLMGETRDQSPQQQREMLASALQEPHEWSPGQGTTQIIEQIDALLREVRIRLRSGAQ